jgi:predicted O-linked N-acetylglucosamine transferase (SPINDLY family)
MWSHGLQTVISIDSQEVHKGFLLMAETMAIDLADWRQQVVQAWLEGSYSQAVELYQYLIDAEPEEKSHCWHLGLALLLQGEEAEAQTAWMLAMMDGEPEQVNQWTVELIAVLQTEAERREALSDVATAWAIRQHIREINPHDLDNLLHLVGLSLEVGTFTPENLSELALVDLLQSEAVATLASTDYLLKLLEQLLEIDPAAPGVQDFASACLHTAADPLPFVLKVIQRAVEIGTGRGHPQLAVRYTQMCLEVIPNNLSLLSHLSTFLQNADRHAEGIEAARTYCTLARSLPDQVFGAFIMLRALMRAGGYWDTIFPIFEHQGTLIDELVKSQTEPLEPDSVFLLVTSTFCQPYIRDSLAQNRLTQNRLMQACQKAVEIHNHDRVTLYRQGFATRSRCQDSNRPLRIGYVSHCLRRHSVGWLCRSLFQHHDREKFQIFGYFWNSNPLWQDDVQQWLMQRMERAHLLGRDSKEIADRIFSDEVDILIDLDSITADIICEVMMLKPAPVQVTWLGWDASGIPAIDYYIADSYVLPESADAHYSEKIVRLPQTYIAVDGFEVGLPNLRREDLNIPADAIVYWSGQSAYKRHPETVRAQLQIIKAVPNSYFLIKGITAENSIQQYFQQMAADVGVEASRLRFLPDVGREEEHRANLAISDVVLDTYPYNGATTTLETLWMGIPLVTRGGETFSSRNSYGMMLNAGITEGIAWSEAEYIEWGIRLGTQPELRQQVAWKLRQARQNAPLWNGKQFTRDMEAAYTQMWQRYEETV